MDITRKTMLENQINKAVKDEEFIKKILTAQKISDAHLLFKQKGIEITDEELKKVGEYIARYAQAISDDELSHISGGQTVEKDSSVTVTKGDVVYWLSRAVGKTIAAPALVLGYILVS